MVNMSSHARHTGVRWLPPRSVPFSTGGHLPRHEATQVGHEGAGSGPPGSGAGLQGGRTRVSGHLRAQGEVTARPEETCQKGTEGDHRM